MTVGTRNMPMTAGKSQRGPMVRSAGRAQYNPPTATTATSAGQRGSGGHWSRAFSGCRSILSAGQGGKYYMVMRSTLFSMLLAVAVMAWPAPQDNIDGFVARSYRKGR